MITDNLEDVVDAVADRTATWQRPSAPLVAVSGIDGSGKTAQSARLAAALMARDLNVALIGIDPWQAPQTLRFGGPDPGEHFYRHAIRFDELFVNVVEPLVRTRSLHLSTLGIRTDADVWYELVYDYENVDLVVLEGIFLFRRTYAPRYDMRIWVDCSFETAVDRALERNVERLPPERIRTDYAEIYHAAQRYHFEVDAPRARADLVFVNDDKLTAGAAAPGADMIQAHALSASKGRLST